jgi:hypothetical protein
LFLEGHAQIAVRAGKPRIQAQRLAKAGDRFVWLPLFGQDIAAVVMRLDIVLLQRQGSIETGHGFRPVALLIQGDAEVIVRCDGVRS